MMNLNRIILWIWLGMIYRFLDLVIFRGRVKWDNEGFFWFLLIFVWVKFIYILGN